MKVLIVDDLQWTIDYFQGAFEDEELTNIDFTTSAKEARQMMGDNDYNKIITDFNLQDNELDGLKLLEIAEANNVVHRILLTSVSDMIDLTESSVTYACRKPWGIQEIRHWVLNEDIAEEEVFQKKVI